MKREKTYRLQTRQPGEAWRTSYAGTNETEIVCAARALAQESITQTIGDRAHTFPRYYDVRVIQGQKLVWDRRCAVRPMVA